MMIMMHVLNIDVIVNNYSRSTDPDCSCLLFKWNVRYKLHLFDGERSCFCETISNS